MSRTGLKLAGMLATLALAACEAPEAENVEADFLLVGGQVVDGTGAAPVMADVAIAGDRIVFVGDASGQAVEATTTIDVSGLVVAPGFIDPHTHADEDLQDPARSLNANYLTQGVTTVVVGNDGWGSPDVQGVSRQMEAAGVGNNVVFLVGHGTIRKQVMDMADRPPTDAELAAMEQLVADAMDAGAIGLSSGLYYVPGNFADTEEVIALALIAAEKGGLYESHLRDESSYNVGLIEAVREAIEIGRVAGLPVHIAHIKALGVDVWGQSEDVINMVEAARAEGVRVTADQYPWLASGTRITNALIPRAAFAGGVEALHRRLNDPESLEELRPQIADNLRRRGGADALLITGGDANIVAGRTLAEEAAARNIDAVEAAIRIVLEGDARVASFNMNPADVEAFMQQPWLSTSSDGSSGHPRKYGSFPEKYQRYVVEKQVLSLEEYVHSSSGRTASLLGLCGRGVIAEGNVSDIVVFDPAGFRANATYLDPKRHSVGVRHLFLSGNQVIEQGALKDVRAGMPLVKREQTSCK